MPAYADPIRAAPQDGTRPVHAQVRRAAPRVPRPPWAKPAEQAVGCGAIVQRKVFIDGVDTPLKAIPPSILGRLGPDERNYLAAMIGKDGLAREHFESEEELLDYVRGGAVAPLLGWGRSAGAAAPSNSANEGGSGVGSYAPPPYKPPPGQARLPSHSAGPGAAASASAGTTPATSAQPASSSGSGAGEYTPPQYKPPASAGLAPQPASSAAAAPAIRAVNVDTDQHRTSDGPMTTGGLENCIAVVAARPGLACLYHFNTGNGAFTSNERQELLPDRAVIGEAKQLVDSAIAPAAAAAAQAGPTHYHIVLGWVWGQGGSHAAKPLWIGNKQRFIAALKEVFPGVTIAGEGHRTADWNPPVLTGRD